MTHLRYATYRAFQLLRKLGGVRWADREPPWHQDRCKPRPSGRQRSELRSSTASAWPYLFGDPVVAVVGMVADRPDLRRLLGWIALDELCAGEQP